MQLHERIKQKRKELGLTQAQLAKKLKVSPTAVTDWETGKSRPWENIVVLSRALGVTVDWLLTGASPEEFFVAAHNVPDKKEPPLTYDKVMDPSEIEQVEIPKMHKIPIVDKIAADHMPTHSESSEFELTDIKFARANHYCLLVKGHSMRPTIHEGDKCIVEKVDYRLEPLLEEIGPADARLWKGLSQEIVCASVDDDYPVLKRLLVTSRKDTGFKVFLQGDNPLSKQIEITKETRLRVMGIVRQVQFNPKHMRG